MTKPTVEELLKRLFSRVRKTETCWLWTGAHCKGYGRLQVNYKTILAHRLSYELMVGPIPIGLQIDHLCRNTFCVRPDHLEPVTGSENVRRGEAGINNKIKTHCPSGHEYTTTSTMEYRGMRYCLICKERHNKSRDRSKRSANG